MQVSYWVTSMEKLKSSEAVFVNQLGLNIENLWEKGMIFCMPHTLLRMHMCNRKSKGRVTSDEHGYVHGGYEPRSLCEWDKSACN